MWAKMDLEGELPVLREQKGTKGPITASYVCDHVGVRKIKAKKRDPLEFLKEVFLPHGYPETVSDDYMQYQLWDTLQAFCSSITTMLATLAVLKGLGVGDDSATPLAAAITWLLRDGTGLASRIVFAWKWGIYLDCNAKQWRLVADVLNDLGRLLELVAPSFPHLFLPLVCVASVFIAIVGSAGTATRAALIQHQARRNNMADVTAKDNSQETMVNLAALVVNLWLSHLVTDSPILVWSVFLVFTFLHLLANYMAVSVVCMETFNKNRLHIMMAHYLATGVVLDPPTVNSREPVIFSENLILTLGSSSRLYYSLGTKLSSLVMSFSSAEFRAAVSRYKRGHRHILKYLPSKRKVLVALHVASSPADQLQAAVAVEVFDYIISGHPISSSPVLAEFSQNIQILKGQGDELAGYVGDEVCPSLLPSLSLALSQAGWDTSHFLLAAGEVRYSWTLDS